MSARTKIASSRDVTSPDSERSRSSVFRSIGEGGGLTIRRLMALPDETRLFQRPDHKAAGRDKFASETTIGVRCLGSVHRHEGVSEVDFESF